MDSTNEPGILCEPNCHKYTTSNSIEVQHSDGIVHKGTVSESTIGNTGSGESILGSHNSENAQSLNEEKILEGEFGSVLEVTEEMLKSCRRRSVLKRRKPDVRDVVLGNNDPDTAEFSECNKTQRERRVTFNGELEFKLPDGRQEFAELVIDDSNEQLEIEHDQNEKKLPVFDDILSDEISEKVFYTACNALEENGTGGEDFGELDREKTEEQNGQGNEAKSETESCEIRGGNNIVEDADTQKGDASKKMVRKTDVTNKIGENVSNEKNGTYSKDEVEDLKGNENGRFSVEADILLSVDRQSQIAQINSDNDVIASNTKTLKPEDGVQVNSQETNCDEIANVQLGETGGRAKGYGPRRGLRHATNSTDNPKPSKRLLDVFGSENKPDEAENKKPPMKEEKKKRQRNKKGKKASSKNESQPKKTNIKKALRKANQPRNEDEGVARNCRRKKGPEKIAQQAKESLVIGNEDHIGKNKNAQTKEEDRKDALFGDSKLEIIGGEVKDNAKEKQDIVNQHGEEDVKDDVQQGQNIVVDEKTKNKRASRKTHQFTSKDKCIARNSRRAKELDKTAQNASKSLLIVENEDNTDINKKTETEEQNRKGKSFGYSRRENVEAKVKDDKKEKQNTVNQNCAEDVNDSVQQGKNMVDDEETKNKRALRKTNQARNKDKGIARNCLRKKELEKTTKEARESLAMKNEDDPDENKNIETIKEQDRKGDSSGESKREKVEVEVEDDTKEKQNIVSQNCSQDVKDSVQQDKDIVDDEKVSSKRASRNTNQLENKDGSIACNCREEKKLEKTAQEPSESLLIENEGDIGGNKDAEAEEQDKNSKSFGNSKREENQDIVDQNCGKDVKDGIQQGQNMANGDCDKEHNGQSVEKKCDGRRRSLRTFRGKMNKVNDMNISGEAKERKTSFRSKKKDRLEPETIEGNKDNAAENVNENMNDVNGTDSKYDVSEKNEKHVNEIDKEQTKAKDITKNKQIKTNLRSRKRKSPELEVTRTHKQNSNDVIQDVNKNENIEHGNGSKEAEVSILNVGKERKTLKSKRKKSLDPGVEDGSKETARVNFEEGETNESLRENVKQKINNKKPTRKNVNTTKTESDTVAVCSKRKRVSRKRKKTESVVDADQNIEGKTLNTDDADPEITSVEVDRKGKEDDGKKRALVETRGTKIKAVNANVNKIMQSGDGNEENYGRKTEKKGRKRDLSESEENDLKGKEISEKVEDKK